MSRVLVISPHPDDESIGCGGTLRGHVERGEDVHVIFLTSGDQGGHGRDPAETRTLREAEARRAAAILELRGVEFWRQPDGALRATRRLVDRLVTQLEILEPEVLYVPHPQESHPDHRAAWRLVQKARTRISRPANALRIMAYEVWTPIQKIDHVEDITAHLESKLSAIRAHESQCAALRFDDACRALARYRGEMHSWPGGDYAEVFQIGEPVTP